MPEFDEVVADGNNHVFPNGSVRSSDVGKGRPGLIPPHALMRLAKHYENGARHYGDRNWERGQPQSRFLDSAMRHMWMYMGGATDEDHLAAAAWNIMAMMHQEEMVERGLLDPDLLDVRTMKDEDGNQLIPLNIFEGKVETEEANERTVKENRLTKEIPIEKVMPGDIVVLEMNNRERHYFRIAETESVRNRYGDSIVLRSAPGEIITQRVSCLVEILTEYGWESLQKNPPPPSHFHQDTSNVEV